MTIYRADMQQKISTPLVSTGVYYWTNVYYFSATTPAEFDFAVDRCGEVQSRAFCLDVTSDRILVTNVATGAVIQHGTFHWVPLNILPDSDMPITNGVIVWLYSDGAKVGYKRYRVPVPKDGQDNGILSNSFVSYYNDDGPINFLKSGVFCTKGGSVIDNAVLDPRVSMWQIRHGSKRSIRRAV